ncbi:MAG: hypothetical protein H7138_01865 [Myxococcales bacterium]|nr:hypothetical protein [Myxococcales bacterium]
MREHRSARRYGLPLARVDQVQLCEVIVNLRRRELREIALDVLEGERGRAQRLIKTVPS